jgi:hypothetical protein
LACLAARAYFLRKKPFIVAGTGVVWLVIGVAWILVEKPIGLGFLLGGGVCLVWGGFNLLRAPKGAGEMVA